MTAEASAPRATMKEICSEFLGTLVLMLFGLAVNAQVTVGEISTQVGDGSVSTYAYGDYLTLNLGWGLAVMMGVYVAGGATGAHLNPAVTVAMACRKKLGWAKVPGYVAAQVIAAIVASGIVYLVYFEQIEFVEQQTQLQAINNAQALPVETDAGMQFRFKVVEGRRTMATAGIFATYPREFDEQLRVTNWTGLIDQFVGTALLLLVICAVVDKRNIGPDFSLAPIAIGAIVMVIGMGFGANCGYAVNPARDFGPRLFSYFGGWGSQVFLVPDNYWYLVPIAGPVLGGIAGVVLYDAMITRFHSGNTASSDLQELDS